MNTITIPKKSNSANDFVVVPRKEYKALLELKKIREFAPTIAQKKALIQARKNQKARNYFMLDELRKKLGFTG